MSLISYQDFHNNENVFMASIYSRYLKKLHIISASNNVSEGFQLQSWNKNLPTELHFKFHVQQEQIALLKCKLNSSHFMFCLIFLFVVSKDSMIRACVFKSSLHPLDSHFPIESLLCKFCTAKRDCNMYDTHIS